MKKAFRVNTGKFLPFIMGLLISQGIYSQSWTAGTGILYANPATTKIGIGVTAPAYPLDIAGVMRATTSTQSSTAFVLTNSHTSFNNSLLYGYTSAAASSSFKLLDLRTSGGSANAMWVNGLGNAYFAGNVGIGTTSPGNTLSLFNNGKCGLHLDNNTCDWDIEAYNITTGGLGGFYLKQRGNVLMSIFNDGSGPVFSTGGMVICSNHSGTGYFEPYGSNFDINVGGGGSMTFFDDVSQSYKFKLLNGNMFLDGKITCKEIEVKTNVWADHVFKKGYKLRPLAEVENYIKTNCHLPEVPTEAEVKEKGVNVGDMNALLLKKVEELTLYIIQQQKEIDELKSEIRNKE